MSGLEAALGGLSQLTLRAKLRNDDAIDQLHHFVTVAILVAFAVLTGVMEFTSDPINCWNPGKYLWKHYQDHVNTYCQTQPLYRYPDSGNHSVLPYSLGQQGGADNSSLQQLTQQEHSLHFLHWTSVFFVLQALLFKLPHVVWGEVNASRGSNIQQMVEMLQTSVFKAPADRAHTISHVALFLEKWLRIYRKPSWFPPSVPGPGDKKPVPVSQVPEGWLVSGVGSLSCVYLLVKGLYLLNTLLQFLLLSAFLRTDFWQFGVLTLRSYDSVDNLFRAHSRLLPLLALCHFQTFDQTGPTGYWVQCMLTINMFLEKLFLLQWFWLLLLLILTSVSCAVWCFRMLQTDSWVQLVQRYLKVTHAYSTAAPVPASCSLQRFVSRYLGREGVFVLRLLEINTSQVVVAQLMEELWRRYLSLEDTPDTKTQPDGDEKPGP